MEAPKRHKSMMKEVGFVDVKEMVIEFPIGPWAKSEYHKMIGKWYQKDLINGVEGIMMGLLTRVMGMGREEVECLIEEVKRGLLDRKIHAYQPFYVVYGRKPE